MGKLNDIYEFLDGEENVKNQSIFYEEGQIWVYDIFSECR